MKSADAVEYEWPYLSRMIASPEVIEESAVRLGALRRRREVKTADALLRLAMIYGFCGRSLRQTAAYSQMAGLADLSDVAVLKRLRGANEWLGFLLACKLAERATADLPRRDLRVRIIDASNVSVPGSKGADFRLHVSLNLKRFSIDEIDLTDGSGGERLDRFQFAANDLVLADRGYSGFPGLVALASQGTSFVIRLNWQNVPLKKADGSKFDVLEALRSLPEAEPGEFPVFLRAENQLYPVRLVAIRKSEVAAAEARRKILHERNKKQRQLDPRTLEHAGFIFVLTNLSASDLPAADALELYRFRWQVELVFKRLKSILGFDELAAKDPALARTHLFAKLLGALAIEDLAERYLSFSPWGYSHTGPVGFHLAPSSDLP